MALRRIGMLLTSRTSAAATTRLPTLTMIPSRVNTLPGSHVHVHPPTHHLHMLTGSWAGGGGGASAHMSSRTSRATTSHLVVSTGQRRGRGSQSTSSPMGVSDTDMRDTEVERQYIPGFENHVDTSKGESETVRRMFDLQNAPNSQIVRVEVQKAMEAFKRTPSDTGSTPVQVAVLTTRIKNAQKHTISNRKDISGRRGLVAMIEKRRKLLQYLKRKDFAKYNEVIRALNIRPVAGLR
eukprot:m.203574 g.203574  ORF g.203574 m.203574 type:complete len:238 (-) comp25277_c0_seq1:242-955(-)